MLALLYEAICIALQNLYKSKPWVRQNQTEHKAQSCKFNIFSYIVISGGLNFFLQFQVNFNVPVITIVASHHLSLFSILHFDGYGQPAVFALTGI